MSYFVRTDSGAEFGPLTSKQLRDAARSGSLGRRDLVRPNGTVDWFRAERVKGLEFDQKIVPPQVVTDAAIALDDEPASAPSEAPPTVPVLADRAVDLAAHIEVLALRGFHVRALAGETVESVIVQGAVDAARASIPAALLGRRGMLVMTDRRVFVVRAGLASQSIESLYLDRIDGVAFGTRTDPHRFVAGMLALLVGCVMLGIPLLRVAWGVPLSAPLPVFEAALAFALGGIFVVLSRYRALVVSAASGSVAFGKAALGSEAITSVDQLRERAIQRSRGVSASAHIS